MDPFEVVVCEFDLSSAQAAHIRRVVAALDLDMRRPSVVDSVRGVLCSGGYGAFEKGCRLEMWDLQVQYDPSIQQVDVDRATAELRVRYGVESVRWIRNPGCGQIAAGFGFECNRAWNRMLTEALGRKTRKRVIDLVGEFSTVREVGDGEAFPS